MDTSGSAATSNKLHAHVLVAAKGNLAPAAMDLE